MNRTRRLFRLLLAAACLSGLASPALAQSGINLSWNECGVGGFLQRNFACNTNGGTANVMYASAIVGADMPQLNGQAGVLDLQTNRPTLSDWWQFNLGGCRYNSPSYLSANFDFTAAPGGCIDPWLGGAAGGISYTPGFNGPDRARIRTVCAIPGSTAINGVDEHYFFKVQFGNQRSAGAGSCAGCTDGVCIVLNSILVTQPLGVGDYFIFTPITRNHVAWQPGGGIGVNCPYATPARSTTWGSVKSLYR